MGSLTDTEYLVRKGIFTGHRWLSFVTPPLYIAFVLARRGPMALSMNNTLRATWVGGGTGAAVGAGFEYARSAFSNEDVVRMRRFNAAHNAAVIRAEDHSTICALIFSMFFPAFFWNQARLVHLILGGAGIGSAIGSWNYIGITNMGPDSPLQALLPPVPTSPGSPPPES
ncbi:hypothetical protein HGRIS_013441 [Hohenbuehelia grisea]|uniref:Uncharacterized protein n=1 Tax=Hohenbuehelia grisea TaxID=104357 RepID=A0ABR3IVH7_9AGAR